MIDRISHITQNHYTNLLSYPNVVGVSNGYKTRNNIKMDCHCLVVMVSKKYPCCMLRKCDIIPKFYMGVMTDIVETGEFYINASNKDKIRPAQGGYSIALASNTSFTGTLGCLVYDLNFPTTKYILSNNHVIAGSNDAKVGSFIVQPSREDGGKSTDKIAFLQRFEPIKFKTPTSSPENTVDAAIGRLINPNIVVPTISYIGVPTGTVQAFKNQNIKKSGRSTGLTIGTVGSIDSAITVNFGNGKLALFTNVIMGDLYNKKGDSGSLVLDTNNKAVGLLFASSTSGKACINPINPVLSKLGVGLVTTV